MKTSYIYLCDACGSAGLCAWRRTDIPKHRRYEQIRQIHHVGGSGCCAVQGVLAEDGSTIVFKGIPYAAPPVGELRWQKPQPVAAWDTVRVCDSFGPAAVQPPHSDPESFYTKEFYWEGDPEFNEDCLYLNVWTPGDAAGKPEKKLPVAVWIHGGAYTNGWGHEVTMDGQAWAERGVILVTINYRLSAVTPTTSPCSDRAPAPPASRTWSLRP